MKINYTGYFFLGLIRSSNSNRLSTNNEFLTPTSSKLIKSSKIINLLLILF